MYDIYNIIRYVKICLTLHVDCLLGSGTSWGN